MRIGFYVQWPKGSLRNEGNVVGDELHAEGMCKALLKLGMEHCEVYAPNYEPKAPLDVMVYLNDTEPRRNWARRHIAYMQNAYPDGSDKALQRFHQMRFDGYALISKNLLTKHQALGMHGIWLPFGVDTDLFRPPPDGPEYKHEVAYVGNDIKGAERTARYILPAATFDFGLYGNWRLPLKQRMLFWRLQPYQRRFARIGRGKIPQEHVPLLYSRSRINLNCTAQDCVDWDVITLRTFEVLACKGFLISDRVPSAEKELSDSVVFTEGGPDLRQKISYYLSHPSERARYAENGYRYVTAHATSAARMLSLLAYIREITP